MTDHTECPICMDDIVNNTNCVTTECGHQFHSSCLMRSVAHNGFGCPCCRNVMAETPEDDDEDDDDDDDDEDDYIEEQDMLRGFRFFCDNLDGRDHDEEDMQDEDEYEEEIHEEVVAEEVETPVPSADYIAQKLTERGITMATLVKTILSDAHPEYSNKSSYNRSSDSVFGQFRIIITNYAPEPTVALAPSQVV
ncbi:RING finger protein [bacterium]|nr:RING finger protein [bacterium]